MAAIVVREHLRQAGLADRVRVTSAGTDGWHVGDCADSRAQKTLAGRGYPTDHTAAQIGDEHLDADLFLAMDSGHARALRRLVGPERVRMFRSFDPDAGPDLDVPDPYYGDDAGFDTVLTMVEAATPGLVQWIKAQVDPPN